MATTTTPSLLDAELVLTLAGRLRRVAARVAGADASHAQEVRRWQHALVRIGALGSVDPRAAHAEAAVLEHDLDEVLGG